MRQMIFPHSKRIYDGDDFVTDYKEQLITRQTFSFCFLYCFSSSCILFLVLLSLTFIHAGAIQEKRKEANPII